MSKSVGRSNKETKKTRKNKKYLEELEKQEEQDLSIDDLSETSTDESETDLSETDEDDDEDEYVTKEPSISKELNKMIDETIKDIKESDLVVPAIGLGLLSIIGFALYKGSKM